MEKQEIKEQLWNAGYIGSLFTSILFIIATFTTQANKLEQLGYLSLGIILLFILFYHLNNVTKWYNETE